MTEDLAIGAVILSAALAAAVPIARKRPDWTTRRVALLAALPLPLAGILVCICAFVDAAITPADQCGTDACAMAMAGAAMLIVICLVAYGVSFMIVEAVLHRRARR